MNGAVVIYKQKTACEGLRSDVGSGECIGDGARATRRSTGRRVEARRVASISRVRASGSGNLGTGRGGAEERGSSAHALPGELLGGNGEVEAVADTHLTLPTNR